MKKSLLAVLSAVLLSHVAAAAESPRAAELPRPTVVKMTLEKKGQMVQDVQVDVVRGEAMMSATTLHQFQGSNCTTASTNLVQLPNYVTSGMNVRLKSLSGGGDGLYLSVSMDLVEFDGMGTHQDANGCTVELPRTHGFNNIFVVNLKKGKPVSLPATMGADHYVFTLTAQ
jgi:hypothetical protein